MFGEREREREREREGLFLAKPGKYVYQDMEEPKGERAEDDADVSYPSRKLVQKKSERAKAPTSAQSSRA